MSRMNQWFVLGDGIAREVITADIQRYLGPDALVRPGTGTGDHEGRPGYWITAYRTLTSQMIQDLRMDSQRWRAEKDNDQRAHRSGVAYQDSQTHASRQYHGPTEGRATSHPASSYGGASESHYTTTPTPTYPAHQGYGPPATHTTQPRTDPYAANNYGQPAAVAADYRYPATTPAYAYPPQTPQDPYGRPTVTPHYAPQQPRYFGYFDDQFLVYR
ncbi:hypothetical protein P280DRAFT_6053 [Massarina eburnea CBS 473.64]|uniref:Uncharacterized protein n=1 Tax=Massarina eburnea CBS 473.64 TaxID=1395130 RepID=A0A6A6SEK7_9PLEO|nr:hypothetical protein P280DRAFT_6053 [Massarina eburnea CBS 473.64]